MVNLVAMAVNRGMMEKYQNRHTRQVEHATKQWEARAHKIANNNDTRKWLERQNNANYRNEHGIIRGDFSRYKIPFLPPVRLQKRKK